MIVVEQGLAEKAELATDLSHQKMVGNLLKRKLLFHVEEEC